MAMRLPRLRLRTLMIAVAVAAVVVPMVMWTIERWHPSPSNPKAVRAAAPLVARKMALTQAQAVAIARAAATAKGIDLSLFDPPSITTDPSGKLWYIFFSLKGPLVPAGGWFGVEVEDSTMATQIIPGA